MPTFSNDDVDEEVVIALNKADDDDNWVEDDDGNILNLPRCPKI